MRLRSQAQNRISYWLALLPVGLYLCSIPLFGVLIHDIGGHDLARISQILLGVVSATVLLFGRYRPSFGGKQVLLTGLLVLFLALTSVATAPLPEMALRELTLLLGACAVIALVASSRATDPIFAYITASASLFYAVVVVLLATVALVSEGKIDRAALFIGYDNHRFYNHVQTAAIPLALAAAFTLNLPSVIRWLVYVVLVTSWALIFASGGRGTFVALILSSILVWGALGRRVWPVVRLQLGAMCAGLLLFVVVFIALPSVLTTGSPPMSDYALSRLGSSQSRLYLWEVAWQQILHAPVLGIGPMHSAHWPNLKAAHPHNVFLQIAAEWGIPMLVISVVTGVWLLRRMVRAVSQASDGANVGAALLLGLLAVGLDGLVSGNFVMPVSQVWIAVLIGWSLAWQQGQSTLSNLERPQIQRTLGFVHPLAVVALLLHLWLIWAITPEVRDLEGHLERTQANFPTERSQPRFWSHGRF